MAEAMPFIPGVPRTPQDSPWSLNKSLQKEVMGRNKGEKEEEKKRGRKGRQWAK